MQEKNMNDGIIPFNKAVRAGNFKLWRIRQNIDWQPTAEDVKDDETKELLVAGKIRLKKRNVSIEAICVSNLDGTWQTRIPQTFSMFGTLSECYRQSVVAEKEEDRSAAMSQLATILSDMYYVSCIDNGYYHHGVTMLTAAYARPDLLRGGKEGRAFEKEAHETVKGFLGWRKEYDELMKRNAPTDEDMEREETAAAMTEQMEDDTAE